MRRILMLCAALTLALIAAASSAEIFIDRQPPDDWAEKDVLRLTTFPAVSNDAALLEVGGKSMLIDGGVRQWTENVRASLTAMGYGDGVDVIFNTHPHNDHISCQIALVEQGFRAEAFWSSFPEDFNDPYQKEMTAALTAAGIPYRRIGNGEEIDFGGAHLIFWYFPEGKDPNAQSCITHITFGSATMLLTGDASTGAQDYFHKELGERLRADILKFPHHAITVARTKFLNDVAPGFVYITSLRTGTVKANDQLSRHRIPYKHTSMGPLTIVTDGTDWYIWQVYAPYYPH
ncbi:MAG: MBL fold metallo-hydrolase [Clostridia bacterium]|nr:MBL fold metallo-hydrolase [Clostridia bacterium]MBR4457922.1 MBL fold metallo-hydrolase [Clostridia bacterium]